MHTDLTCLGETRGGGAPLGGCPGQDERQGVVPDYSPGTKYDYNSRHVDDSCTGVDGQLDHNQEGGWCGDGKNK